MRPRLREVALVAGVSEATVSRVVNGKPGVSETTREAVLRALDERGWQPRGLVASRHGGTVGLVTPELTNPVFPAMAQAVAARLARDALITVLCAKTPHGLREGDYVEMLVERGVAGIIFLSGRHADTTEEPKRYRRLVDAGLPIVLVNGYRDDLDAAFISADDVSAAELGTRHLLDLGHVRIGFAAGDLRTVPAQRKRLGYLRTLEAAGLGGGDALVAESRYSVEGGHVAASWLLDAGVTAILAGSDLMALGAIRACRERDLAVPRDISVVGYDDTALMAFTDPPLTTLRQPVAMMGQAAAQILLDLIAGTRPADRGEYLYRPELIVRASTGPCAVRAPVVPVA